MSFINFNNATNDSSKNELHNSNQIIKKQKNLDENIEDNSSIKIFLKNKFLVNAINNIEPKDYSKTSNFFYRKKFIISSKPNSNSFNILDHSSKDNIINIERYPRIPNKKSLSSKIKNLKQHLLLIKEKSLTKCAKNNIKKPYKKHKTKNYFIEDLEKKKFNPVLLYNKLSNSNNNNTNDSSNINNIHDTKIKELKFKVFHKIKKNYKPLCMHFISNSDSINKKIREYYTSENYKKIFKSYKKHFHFKMKVETNPKIDTYVNIQKINDQSLFTQKLNLDDYFTEDEKNLLLLEPDYYFKNINTDCIENAKIIKGNTLAERINREDIRQEQLNRRNDKNKNKIKSKKNLKFNLTIDEVNKTEIKNKRNHKRLYKMFEEEHLNEYRENRKFIENLIKKETLLKKGKTMLDTQEAIHNEIKRGYARYNHFLKKKNLIYIKSNPISINKINKTVYLETKNNLLSSNFIHLMKDEKIIEKINKINKRGMTSNSLYERKSTISKDDLKNMSKTKQLEYIKMYVNNIKQIYRKIDK